MIKLSALGMVTVASLVGCDTSAGCANEVASRLPSPSGHLEAVVFNRGCGATTGFNTQLSVLPRGQLPQGVGNSLVLKGQVRLRLVWQSEGVLHVAGMDRANVIRQETQVARTRISYSK